MNLVSLAHVRSTSKEHMVTLMSSGCLENIMYILCMYTAGTYIPNWTVEIYIIMYLMYVHVGMLMCMHIAAETELFHGHL